MNSQSKALSQELKLYRRSVKNSKRILESFKEKIKDSPSTSRMYQEEIVSLINDSIIARQNKIKNLENQITILLG